MLATATSRLTFSSVVVRRNINTDSGLSIASRTSCRWRTFSSLICHQHRPQHILDSTNTLSQLTHLLWSDDWTTSMCNVIRYQFSCFRAMASPCICICLYLIVCCLYLTVCCLYLTVCCLYRTVCCFSVISALLPVINVMMMIRRNWMSFVYLTQNLINQHSLLCVICDNDSDLQASFNQLMKYWVSLCHQLEHGTVPECCQIEVISSL